jgi:hypothetical protein
MDNKSVTYYGQNIYHGNFTNTEINLLEEFVGFTFWKIKHIIFNEEWLQFTAWHKTWNSDSRVVAYNVYDLMKYMEHADEGDNHRSPNRLTRLNY